MKTRGFNVVIILFFLICIVLGYYFYAGIVMGSLELILICGSLLIFLVGIIYVIYKFQSFLEDYYKK